MEFYNERRGILARYCIEAPLPGLAVLSGRHALLAEYPSPPQRPRLSLFQQAQRVGGQDASEWVLYRIAKDDGLEQTGTVTLATPRSDSASPGIVAQPDFLT